MLIGQNSMLFVCYYRTDKTKKQKTKNKKEKQQQENKKKKTNGHASLATV